MNYKLLFIALSGVFLSSFTHAVDNEYTVNIQSKLTSCKSLVAQAVQALSQGSFEKNCRAFVHDTQWRIGEIGIFIFDESGACYAFGPDTRFIWQTFKDTTTTTEDEFIPSLFKIGKQGGFISYKWNNSFMESYVKVIQKDGKLYAVGAGFFPTSAEYRTEQMVKRAVRYGSANGAKRLLDAINNPTGMFVQGEIYLYAYDFEGNVVAHGESLELVGQNVMDSMSSDGKYRTRDIIDIAKSPEGTGWYSYASRQGGIDKRSYVERFVDPNTNKKYAIVGGYYPAIDADSVQTLVKKSANYLRSFGAEKAFPEFSKKLGDFAFGSVTLFAYDTQGVMKADMSNPAFVGINLMHTRDAEGKYITKTIIETAQKYPHGSWVSFSMKNAYAMMYIEKISIPDGDFILGATYYPSDKYIYVRFMVDKAAQFLSGHPKTEAFNLFSSTDPDFLHGDVNIFVFTNADTVLVDGQNKNKIWQDSSVLRDDKGKPLSRKMAAIASSGGGWFEFAHNNAKRRIYVKMVEKETSVKNQVERFIVGSGYYL